MRNPLCGYIRVSQAFISIASRHSESLFESAPHLPSAAELTPDHIFRPQGNEASGDWSVGQQEPYWRTNTSYSPPPSRWDFRLSFEGMPYALNGPDQLDGSSVSPVTKGSRGRTRGNHQHSVSDFGSDFLQAPHWTPPAFQEINVHQSAGIRRRDPASRSLFFAPPFEESSAINDSLGSSSSRSDSSGSDLISGFQFPTHRNSFGRCFFISKPVHPVSMPIQSPVQEASDVDQRLSSASSSVDFSVIDASDPLGSEVFDGSCNLNAQRCGLCGRLLMQRSPWSSRRIVKSGDLPVAGVLSCHHVFHAECLEQMSSKPQKSDPPCPLCAKMDYYNSPDRRMYSRLSNFPRLRTFSEESLPSRPWGCGQVGDCVEGALHAPPRNSTVLLNRERLKKNLSLKGASLGKEFPGKLKRSGACSIRQAGTSKAAVQPSPERCENL